MKECVIEAIKKKCVKVRVLDNGWCLFVYGQYHYVYIPDDENGMIRISIPYFTKSSDYTSEELDVAINEVNREVKFIKVMVLMNGSVSLNYDHKISNDEKVDEIVYYMIRTLSVASEYLKRKLQNKKVTGVGYF